MIAQNLKFGKIYSHFRDNFGNVTHLFLKMRLGLKSIEEGGAFSILGDEVYVAVELVHNQLGDDEAQSDPIGVQLLLLILDGAEQFE